MSTPAKRPAKKTTAKKAAPAKRATKRPSPRKPAAKKTTPRKPGVTARDRQVLELRTQGKTFEAIATTLKFRDLGAVHASYEKALAATLPATPDEQKRHQLDQLLALETKLWPKAERGNLAAIDQLASIAIERQHLISGDPLPADNKRRLGPVEAATAGECKRLEHVAPALAATALVLARVVDEHKDDAGPAATASRELRMHMSQLRGLAGTAQPVKPGGTPDDPAAKTGGQAKSGQDGGATVTDLESLRQRASERHTS